MRFLPISTIVCVLFAAVAAAQGPNSGAVSGTVTDSSGAALPGVKVTAISPALQGEETFVTNEQGNYRFPSLPIGVYKFTYEVSGFATLVRDQITVSLGFAATLNAQMGVASQQQTVVVTGEAPLVDTQNSNVQNNFSTQQLNEIPNGRDMWSVIGVTPGMAVTTIDVGGSNVGNQTAYSAYGYGLGSYTQNRVQVDGVNTTEGTGSAGFYYDYGSFAEFQISTAANDASMPVPGNLVNAVIKTGGNQFHGTVYFDYENPNFQGTNISHAQLLQGAGVGTRLTQYKDINGDVGGPILHDRFWFFVSLRDQEAGRSVTGFPVEKPGSIPALSKDRNITYKLSYEITKNHRLSTYAQWGQVVKPQRNAANNYYSDAVYTQNAASWAGNVQYDGSITPRLFIEARIGTFGYNFPMIPYAGPDGVVDPLRTELTSGDIAGGYAKARTDRRRNQIEPTGSYFLDNFLGANHQFKFGEVSEREYTNAQSYGPVNQAAQVYNSPAGSPDFTKLYEITLYNDPTVSQDYLWHHGAYLQDQVKVGKRITLNLGTRWDFYRQYEPSQPIRPDARFSSFFYQGAPLPNGFAIPARYSNLAVPGRQVVRYPFLIVPRLGLAWDLTGSGKTVLKLNWGTFHSNPGNTLGGVVNPLQEITYTFLWNNPNDLPFDVNQLGAFVSNKGNTGITVQPHIRAPSYDDAGATLERQLSNSLSIRVGFIYRALHHNWQQVDIARTANLFTLPVSKVDPGPDGIAGTADDSTITLYDIPKAQLPANQLQIQAPDGNNEIYRSFEFTINKRLSHRFLALGSFNYTSGNYPLARTSSSGFNTGAATFADMAINNQVHGASTWASHVTGTYFGPWGINISPVLRMQSGAPLPRYVTFTGLNVGSLVIPVDPVGTYRSDDLYVLDTRLEKQFAHRERFRLGVFFDAFNILNSNADNTQDAITGVRSTVVGGTKLTYQRFLSPLTILPPRVFRVGVRFQF